MRLPGGGLPWLKAGIRYLVLWSPGSPLSGYGGSLCGVRKASGGGLKLLLVTVVGVVRYVFDRFSWTSIIIVFGYDFVPSRKYADGVNKKNFLCCSARGAFLWRQSCLDRMKWLVNVLTVCWTKNRITETGRLDTIGQRQNRYNIAIKAGYDNIIFW